MWTWTTTEVSQNVHVIEATMPKARRRGNTFEILIQADQHADNAKCDRALLKRHLEQAKEKNAPVLGLGDLFCVMGGPHDKRASPASRKNYAEREDYYDATVEDVVELHKPFAEQLAVYAYGNHETSVKKHSGTDVLARWAYNLKAETGHAPFIGGYGGWVFVRLMEEGSSRWSQTVKVKYFHGSGGGGKVTRGVLNTRNAQWIPDADVCLSGHIHQDWSMTITRERVTDQGRIYLDDQIWAVAPTYKEEYNQGIGGWHVERGSPPKPVGGLWLVLTVDSVQRKGQNDYVVRADVRRAR